MRMKVLNVMPVDDSHGNLDGMDDVLICPICGWHFTALARVEVVSPGTENGKVTIDSQGVRINPDAPARDRSSNVKITYACEQGHLWSHETLFYKGNTFFKMEGDDCEIGVEGPIWRN